MFKSALIFCFSLFLLSPLNRVSAQKNLSGIDTVFGFDPVLYNGRQYTYKPPSNSTGNPFLFENFQSGWVMVMDRTYYDLSLNYDILNQALLLKYVDHAGATVVIEVSDSWLNSFGIGDYSFELHEQGGSRPLIYQVIKDGSVKIQYHWQKELNLENVASIPVYAFSRPKRSSTVNINGKEFAYENNREFIKTFKVEIQVRIKYYLRANKIKVKKSSDKAISSLVNYCNTLLNP
jgi:hypothetical protein